MRQFDVLAIWDPEAGVWVATSDDVPGLVTEALSMEVLIEKLKVMIPELLDANGYEDGDEVPFTLRTERSVVAYRHAAQ
jgi:predicted RNase H-like HicB family nuclease